jgi:hypothetical protein
LTLPTLLGSLRKRTKTLRESIKMFRERTKTLRKSIKTFRERTITPGRLPIMVLYNYPCLIMNRANWKSAGLHWEIPRRTHYV